MQVKSLLRLARNNRLDNRSKAVRMKMQDRAKNSDFKRL